MSRMLAGKDDGWFKRRFISPVVAELTSGVTPERLSWTVALGMVLGVFPIMGTTTLVCLLAGWILRLNQPVLHVARVVVYPLHLALILVFIHLGEHLFGAPLLSFSIPELVVKFKDSPARFVSEFGVAAMHGVAAWLLVAPFATWLLKMAALPILRHLKYLILKGREVAC